MLAAKLTEKRVVGGSGPNAGSTEAHSFGGCNGRAPSRSGALGRGSLQRTQPCLARMEAQSWAPIANAASD
jgi:hypothetical protein